MPERAVVDSSVFAAVVVRESGWEALATRLSELPRVRTAPFFRFECANVLWKRRADLGMDEARAAMTLLWTLPVDDAFDAETAWAAQDLARRLALPFYDAAFLAIAKREGLPLWTLDARQADLATTEGLALA